MITIIQMVTVLCDLTLIRGRVIDCVVIMPEILCLLVSS